MIGAIIGDTVGSIYEFDNVKIKNFKVFTKDTRFTDDSVLTIALMDWILHSKEKTTLSAANYLKKWARKYPNSGFGGMFYYWMKSEDMQPYNSCGNGSAMRISAIGWAAKDEEDLKDLVLAATACTHNHPEGIKGALVTATCIYKALRGATKDELRKYIISQYPEVETLDYEELRRTYYHGPEICQLTVPEALFCFLISNDFEDCLRTTISIGGDCDTTSAISCAIAEAYYKKIPTYLKKGVRKRLKSDMIEIVDEFQKVFSF